MRNLFFLFLLLLPTPLAAEIRVNSSYEPFEKIIVGCDCVPEDGTELQRIWTFDGDCDYEIIGDGAHVHVWAPPGKHSIEQTVIAHKYREVQVFMPDPENPNDITKAKLTTIRITESVKVDRYVAKFEVLGKPPGPEPQPDPEPAPVPTDGLVVLILEETADRNKLPVSQQEILTSTKIREYLIQKCIKGPDGKTPEYRIWDDDVDLQYAPQLWKDIMANYPPKSLPWIVVSNGKAGFAGPLPATVDETLTLLKKYGG